MVVGIDEATETAFKEAQKVDERGQRRVGCRVITPAGFPGFIVRYDAGTVLVRKDDPPADSVFNPADLIPPESPKARRFIFPFDNPDSYKNGVFEEAISRYKTLFRR